MDNEQLNLRKMTFDDIAYDDNWLVMWRRLNIGRILRQSGVTMGAPAWFWAINMPGMPRPAHWCRNGTCLADCQRQFNTAWATVRAGVSATTARRRLQTWPHDRPAWLGTIGANDR